MKKILKFFPTLLCLAIFAICLYLFFSFSRKTIKPKEADYKVLSVSIDEIIDLLQLATLEIPFSEYEAPKVKGDWKSLGAYDKYLYIERGLLTLGVDLKTNNDSQLPRIDINNEDKSINIAIPDVKILNYTRFTDTQNLPSCEFYLVKNSELIDSTPEKLKFDNDIPLMIEKKVKEKYFNETYKDLARNSAREYIASMLKAFYPDYSANITFEKNEELGNEG